MNRALRWHLTGGDRRSIADSKRVRAIVSPSRVAFPQTFVRAWALDSLATFAARRRRLEPLVERYLYEFENSNSAALRARARNIRARQ